MRKILGLAMVLTLGLAMPLAGCGNRATLEPARGGELPVAPYGAKERPNADALLETTPQAAPGRSVELRKRSEVRQDDPFDFPPEG